MSLVLYLPVFKSDINGKFLHLIPSFTTATLFYFEGVPTAPTIKSFIP